jgi:hypothetical protein
MIIVSDKEYLSRDLLNNVSYTIEDNKIDIACSHTCFIRTKRHKTINKTELLNLYKHVSSTAKAKHVKVSRKNAYKKFITDNWNNYISELDRYNTIFDEMIILYKQVQERGLHCGYSDDCVYNQASELWRKYQHSFYRTSILDKFEEIKHELQELSEDLKKDNLIQITL